MKTGPSRLPLELGAGLRRLRLAALLTQDELAEAMGLNGQEATRSAQGSRRKGTKLKLQDRLDAQDAEWRRQRLDLGLVARVREVAVEEFTRLIADRPVLFGQA